MAGSDAGPGAGTGRLNVVIATPLEPRLVHSIAHAVPEARVHFHPELLPAPCYPCDHRGDPAFRRSEQQERAWWDLLAKAHVLLGVPGEDPAMLTRVVREAPHLRWIQGTAAGTGELVRKAGLNPAELERVALTAANGVHASQLAEWVMFGLLAFTKGLPKLLADAAARDWTHYPVRELRGRRLLVVGMGAIGREVARQAAAMGMQVTGVRRSSAFRAGVGSGAGTGPAGNAVELPRFVAEADAVVLALPHTPETVGLFSRELIGLLRPEAVVVNVGRGATVDEQALIEALIDSRIAGAALDVFAVEPLPQDSPLWSLPNVLISPHTAALSLGEDERIVDLFIANLRRWLADEPLAGLIFSGLFY